jgi:hypothetical protein
MTANTIDVRISDEEREAIARRVAELLAEVMQAEDAWLDSAGAARHLGISRDSLDKLCAERRLPFYSDGPGCKRYFAKGELDAWRRGQT